LVQGAGEQGGHAGAAAALEQARSNYGQLAQGIEGLCSGASQPSSGASSLSSGMGELQSGCSELAGGVDDYTSGVYELLSAASEMGLGDMAEGLAGGLHPVADDSTYT
jgi:putative membrane protein